MLEGIIRESIDKKATKALRRDGYLIANIYGKGQENVNAAFKANEFIKAAKTKDSLVFPVKVGGKEYKVVIQEYQKEPINSSLLHVDLKIAIDGVEGKYMVPVNLIGIPKGTKNKGVLIQSKKRLAVKCKPENLPKSFDVDVSGLDVGDAILVRDVKVSNDLKILAEDRIAVAGVIKAK
ncbi:MAG: 50S ribosomal protein L25/general stress protein Ctc [Sulfurospirillaceae bacterium]|nr:50S ribosomal protein L25/general stress protein Ctc [Sulfurospirillaceae bacterium]MDD3462158.1 50S ribosomal protein L25/general stress protein Ctc [Sulfurospirillaceae bacterium]